MHLQLSEKSFSILSTTALFLGGLWSMHKHCLHPSHHRKYGLMLAFHLVLPDPVSEPSCSSSLEHHVILCDECQPYLSPYHMLWLQLWLELFLLSIVHVILLYTVHLSIMSHIFNSFHSQWLKNWAYIHNKVWVDYGASVSNNLFHSSCKAWKITSASWRSQSFVWHCFLDYMEGYVSSVDRSFGCCRFFGVAVVVSTIVGMLGKSCLMLSMWAYLLQKCLPVK